MTTNRRHALAIAAVLAAGLILFGAGTDGFRAFTSEAARVNRLMMEKPPFPEVVLEDGNGRTYTISEFRGKYVLLSFMYTFCPDLCVITEMNMAQIYAGVPEQDLGENLVFLSISFDPARDDPAALDRYRHHFGSDGETWRMVRVPDPEELDLLLKRFGVIVIPDGNGNFAHNSAFYLLDRSGRLLKVMDYAKPEEAARVVTAILENDRGA